MSATDTLTRARVLGYWCDLLQSHHLPGHVQTADLIRRWRCHQSTVSRRLMAMHDAGLAFVTTSRRGTYWIDPLMPQRLEIDYLTPQPASATARAGFTSTTP
jgi:DNA-binding IclR family transcriptional regulator